MLNNSAEDIYTDEFQPFLARKRVYLVMGSIFAMVSAVLIWLALQYLRDVRTGRTRRMEITVHHIGAPAKYGRPMQYTRPDRAVIQHTNIPAEYNWPLESVQLPQRARMWNTYYGGRLLRLEFKESNETFCVLQDKLSVR